MKIRVDEIPEAGRFLHIHWKQAQLDRMQAPDDPSPVRLARPVNVDLEIQRRSDHLEVTGTIRGTLRLACDRCLEDFSWELRRGVRILLFDETRTPTEEEKELEPEELEYEFFDGVIIDVDRMIAEEIFLELPFRSLCSESCRGLCPGCGVNLNTETCRCSKPADDHPFAALAALNLNGEP